MIFTQHTGNLHSPLTSLLTPIYTKITNDCELPLSNSESCPTNYTNASECTLVTDPSHTPPSHTLSHSMFTATSYRAVLVPYLPVRQSVVLLQAAYRHTNVT